MKLIHCWSAVSTRLPRLVYLDTLTAQHLSATVQRVLLFAAFEAKAEGGAEIVPAHLALGALREKRDHSDAAKALRARIPVGSGHPFPLKLSKAAMRLCQSAKSADDFLRRE